MKVSFKWLKKYVSLPDVDIKEFCDAMTMSGSKVETYETVGMHLKNVVTGQVASIVKHPNAERLVVCKVDVTEKYGSMLQIVTGAKNFKVNDVVPVALDGAVLPENVKIKSSTLRGMKSEGMMCSLSELGLSNKNIADEGIYIFSQGTEIGKDVNDILDLDDYIIDFEITPNRPDCLSVIGLAREAAATFRTKLIAFDESDFVVFEESNKSNLNLNVENSVLCPYYSARIIEGIVVGESPNFIKSRLRSMGVKSINNVVDITNFVMLEYGQPLHAFDYDCVHGKSIVARLAKEGERLITLDGTNLNLTPEDLVISDSVQPIALAGVMGGLDSGIKDSTRTVILESANFDPISIRKSSKRHNVRTEASSRYEKGLPKENCVFAMNRACYLLKKYCQCSCASKVYEVGTNKSKKVEITLDTRFVNKFLNINLSLDEMKSILERLGFVLEKNKVTVPYFRADVNNQYDIAEEIARFYGYNNIISTTLKGTSFSKTTKYDSFKEKVCFIMQGLGLTEILTSPFESPDFYEKLLLDKEDHERGTVGISNPLGLETSLMRPFLESSLLKVLRNNFNYKNTEVKCFEIAKIYKLEESSSKPQEIEHLIAGFYGDNIDFFYIKGILEELFRKLNIRDFRFTNESKYHFLHPGICARVFSRDSSNFGYAGKIHPSVAQNYELPSNTYLFNIDIDQIFKYSDKEITYERIPNYPTIVRDVSLTCDEDLTVEFLETLIKDYASSKLVGTELFDIYRGPQIPKNKKSLAFRLIFRAKDRTLTEEEVNESFNKMLSALKGAGIELRTLAKNKAR